MDIEGLRHFIGNLASKLEGTPYIWGGSSPATGLDCSGFCVWVLQVFEVLPSGDWSAAGLSTRWMHTSEPKTGDLAFYGTPSRVSHVMMHLGPEWVIGASGGDSTTTDREEALRKGAMVKVKRTRYRGDYLFSVGVAIPETFITT